MSVEELLEQAKALSPEERRELANRLIDIADQEEVMDHNQLTEHWGQALNKLMDEIGPIEMKYPEIEDPVEWVKHLRAESRKRRLGN